MIRSEGMVLRKVNRVVRRGSALRPFPSWKKEAETKDEPRSTLKTAIERVDKSQAGYRRRDPAPFRTMLSLHATYLQIIYHSRT